jgi:hypothetical protein
MRTSDSIVELTKALITARTQFAPIRRELTAHVSATRSYQYADLAGVLESTLPHMLAQGLIVFQAVDAETGTLITRVSHASGEWVESAYPVHVDQTPQQLGSALTYARRYSLLALLCLAQEDDDGAAAQPAATKRGRGRPVQRATRTGAPIRATADGPQPVPPAATTDAYISPTQQQRLFAVARTSGWSTSAVRAHLRAAYGVLHSRDVHVSDFDRLLAELEQPAAAPPPHPVDASVP